MCQLPLKDKHAKQMQKILSTDWGSSRWWNRVCLFQHFSGSFVLIYKIFMKGVCEVSTTEGRVLTEE